LATPIVISVSFSSETSISPGVVEDVRGKKYFREFKQVTEDPGEGWVEYHWNRPGEKDHRFKRTFIKRIPGENIYIGAGYYPESKEVKPEKKTATK
jgi:signal transduction histidine kinase